MAPQQLRLVPQRLHSVPQQLILAPQWLFITSAIFTAEVDQINLVLYNQMHVDQALELVKRVPGSMEVLTVGLLPTEGDQEPTPAVPPANPTVVQAIDHSLHVEGGFHLKFQKKGTYQPICPLP